MEELFPVPRGQSRRLQIEDDSYTWPRFCLQSNSPLPCVTAYHCAITMSENSAPDAQPILPPDSCYLSSCCALSHSKGKHLDWWSMIEIPSHVLDRKCYTQSKNLYWHVQGGLMKEYTYPVFKWNKMKSEAAICFSAKSIQLYWGISGAAPPLGSVKVWWLGAAAEFTMCEAKSVQHLAGDLSVAFIFIVISLCSGKELGCLSNNVQITVIASFCSKHGMHGACMPC